MSSQNNAGIPLSHAPDESGYKLLELPPELLELLESQDPPILTLHPSPTAAILKTPHKTYSLRQKNTSNALILLAPTAAGSSRSTAGNEGPGRETAASTSPGLSAIATVKETIELVPEQEAAAAAPEAKGRWHERFGRGR